MSNGGIFDSCNGCEGSCGNSCLKKKNECNIHLKPSRDDYITITYQFNGKTLMVSPCNSTSNLLRLTFDSFLFFVRSSELNLSCCCSNTNITLDSIFNFVCFNSSGKSLHTTNPPRLSIIKFFLIFF